MALFAVLFCLALQRFVNAGGWFKISWFESYLKLLSSRFSKLNAILVLLILIVPVLIVFAIIQIIFAKHWYGFANLILYVLILSFCIDARDLKGRLKKYFESLEGSDMNAASNEVKDFISNASIGNISELCREVTRSILYSSFEKIFAGLFWFIAFKVYGLITYFIIVMLSESALRVSPDYEKLSELSNKIRNVLEWVPARLLGFTFALVGNFNKGFNYCRKNLWGGLFGVKNFVIDSGLATLDIGEVEESSDKENKSVLRVVDRVLMVWIVGFILIIIGNIS